MFSETTRILIIDDNNAPFILPLIRCFSGFPLIKLDVLVCSNEKPHLYRYSRYVRKVHHHNGEICNDFEKVLRDAIEQSQAQFIIPTREWIWQLVAENQQWITPIVKVHSLSDRDTIETVTDKSKLNLWLEKNHLPCSRILPVDQNILPAAGTQDFPFPALLKPLKGAGGIGIKPVANLQKLELILAGTEHYKEGYLLQECIDGYDIDVSLFAVSGEILFHTIQRGIMSGSYVFPKGIEFLKNEELLGLTKKMIEKLDYSGIAHLDFRYDVNKDEYILIDFNARYWNSLQGSRIMGVNFPVLAAAYALELPFDRPGYSNGFFYYGTALLKRILLNLSSRNRYPVRLRNSQLHSIILDPWPEIMFLLSALVRPVSNLLKKKHEKPAGT